MSRGTAGAVVVGGGHGGIETAIALRDAGFVDPITVIGDDPHEPYQRPPLSKQIVADAPAVLPIRTLDSLAEAGIELVRGTRVVRIDRDDRSVVTADGARVPYDVLVLATGATARPLPVPGADLPGVLALRTLDEAREITARLRDARAVVVIGAGFIGLEAAALAAARGAAVTVVETAPRVLGRAVSEPMAEHLLRMHRAHGVEVLLERAVERIDPIADGRLLVTTSGGPALEADLVLVGIGVIPHDELARSAGLRVADGVLVDAELRTSDPRIRAVGDCARFPSRYADADPIRLESVQNAAAHARRVARSVCAQDVADEETPWFWSVQGGAKLQIAGLRSPASTAVVRPEPREDRYAVYCFDERGLVAVETVNGAAEHLAARAAIQRRIPIHPDEVRADGFDLRAVVAAADPS